MKLKDQWYFTKLNLLLKSGLKKGLIIPFDDELYQELNRTIFSFCPVDLDIKYLQPVVRPGKCYDRSLKMFFAMNGSKLVRGSLEYFRIKGDIEEANHGWVERDGYVYDPTWLCRFEKGYYYKIFQVQNEYKCTQKEYCESSEYNKELFQKVKNTTRKHLQKDGFDRMELVNVIPLLQGIASTNREFQEELEKYLKEVNYNQAEISEMLEEAFQKSMKKSLIIN